MSTKVTAEVRKMSTYPWTLLLACKESALYGSMRLDVDARYQKDQQEWLDKLQVAIDYKKEHE